MVRPTMLRLSLLWLTLLCATPIAGTAQEPSLPPGLGGTGADGEPALPQGLGGPGAEPAAPPGFAEESEVQVTVTGFVEGRGGIRLRNDPDQDRLSLAETRGQLDVTAFFPGIVTFNVTTDLVLDALDEQTPVDLESGEGLIDLRTLNVVFSPVDSMDMKIGRQILTWGTGDLIFLNDLFPKDFQSFFLGRDPDYLKAPSDAAKTSVYTEIANLDVVFVPRFDADRFIDGSRLSFYSPQAGERIGEDSQVDPIRPDAWFDDIELHGRLYRQFGAYELALYGFNGFYKSPTGVDPTSGRATFPELSVYGTSILGPILGGIGNAEFAFRDSRNDRSGTDPNVPNSEARFLLGYNREVAKDLSMGWQYGLERQLQHNAYRDAAPAGQPLRDQNRHLLTQRVTWLTHNQTVEWSLFVFFSPSDMDTLIRPRVTWDVTDSLALSAGANIFAGTDDHTFFGQFEKNNNVYAAIRYGF